MNGKNTADMLDITSTNEIVVSDNERIICAVASSHFGTIDPDIMEQEDE